MTASRASSNGLSWTSSNGIAIRDHVPSVLRGRWIEQGLCPGRDLYSLFAGQVAAHPSRTSVITPAGAIDYAALDSRACSIAGELVAAGLGRRDIIGIQVPNGWEAVAAELAVAAIGALALPYPPGRGRRDLLSLLGRSRASAAIVADFAANVPLAADLVELRSELPALRSVFVFGSPPAGCIPLDPPPSATGHPSWSWVRQTVDSGAPARILVSSGSETQPKMVAYSHDAIAGGRGRYVSTLHSGTGPMRNLFLVPLASAFGTCGTSVTLACHGGTLILLPTFDPSAALQMITAHRPTHVFAVPTMLRRMTDHPGLQGEDLSSLEAVVAGGAALDEPTFEACRERFDCAVVRLYGSADGVNCHTARGTASGAGCVGRPDPAVTAIRIVDGSGRRVRAGQSGEIWALGPMTPMSYVNSPELDACYRAPGGWVRTGDQGFVDDDGYLHVVDRIKRIVIRGGYNISPAEVEQQLGAHPAIFEAACVAVPDPDLGEILCACLAQRPGTPPLSLAEVHAFLEGDRGLERRKLPELVMNLRELPVGPAGKVCRRTLTRWATGQRALSDGGAPGLDRIDGARRRPEPGLGE